MLLGLVGAEEGAAEEPALDRGLVDDDAVFLVVSSKAGHGGDGVGSVGHLLQGEVL